MEEKDRPKFVALMATLKIAFKEPPMDKMIESAQARIYFEYLSPFSIEKIMQAVDRSIRELKWFPKISELIDLTQPPEPDPTYYPPFKEIGYDTKQMLSREEAKEWCDKIYTELARKDAVMMEKREVKFQERKNILEAQKKIILGLN